MRLPEEAATAIIQFNLAAATLTALVRERLLAEPVCSATAFDLKGKVALLDHVELATASVIRIDEERSVNLPTDDPAFAFSGGYTSTTVAGSMVEVDQDVALHIVTLAELVEKNTSPPTDFIGGLVPQISFRIGVSLNVTALPPRVPSLKFTFRGLKIPTYFASAFRAEDVAKIEEAISAKVASFPATSLPLAPLKALVGPDFEIVNAGATFDEKSETVALRLETREHKADAAQMLSSWKKFYTGAVTERLDDRSGILGGPDWSLFVDRWLVMEQARSQVLLGLAKSPRFKLTSGPDLSWSNPDDRARIIADFEGEIVDACECGIAALGASWKIDVDVSVTATIDVDVPTANTVRTTVSFDWDADNWDLLCCELSAALGWAQLGPTWINEGKIDWGKYLLGVALGPAVVFVKIVLAVSTADLSTAGIDASKFPGPCAIDAGAKKITCTQALSFPASSDLPTMTVASAKGLGHGLLVAGTIEKPKTTRAVLGVAEVSPFEWDWDDPCGRTGLVARGSVELPWTGMAPVVICQVTEGGKRPEQFTPFRAVTVMPGTALIEYVIPEEEVSSAYSAEPEPLIIDVRTSAGARVLTLAPIPPLTPELRAEFAKVKKVRPDFCYSREDDPFLRGFPWKETWDWRPSPGDRDPFRGSDDRLWEIFFGGLRPTDRVEVKDGLEQVIGVASANRNGVTNVSAMLGTGAASEALTLTRLDANAAQPTSPQQWIGRSAPFLVKRTAVQQLALVAPEGGATSLSLLTTGGRPLLFCSTTATFEVFDLRTPERPHLCGYLDTAGMRGVVAFGPTVVGWGDSGLVRVIDGDTLRFERLDDRPALGLAAHGQRIYAVIDGVVNVLDLNFERIGEVEAPDAQYVAVVAGVLAVAGTQGTRFFDLAEPTRPQFVSQLPSEEPRSVSSCRTAEGRHGVFVERSTGGGSIIDLAAPSEPVELANYRTTPWFVGAARSGVLLARVNSDDQTVQVLSRRIASVRN